MKKKKFKKSDKKIWGGDTWKDCFILESTDIEQEHRGKGNCAEHTDDTWGIYPSVQIYMDLSTAYWDVYQLLNDTLYDDFESQVIDKYLYKKFQEAELIDWKDNPRIRLGTESGSFGLLSCRRGVLNVLTVVSCLALGI